VHYFFRGYAKEKTNTSKLKLSNTPQRVYLIGMGVVKKELVIEEFATPFPLENDFIPVENVILYSGFIDGVKLLQNEKRKFVHQECAESSEESPVKLLIREVDFYYLKKDLDKVSEKYGLEVEFSPENLNTRTEKSYLNIIAALLDCISGEVLGVEKHSSIKNQSELIDIISSHYKGYSGLSEIKLQGKFPMAKRSLEES
jgi:hypothetical protein